MWFDCSVFLNDLLLSGGSSSVDSGEAWTVIFAVGLASTAASRCRTSIVLDM